MAKNNIGSKINKKRYTKKKGLGEGVTHKKPQARGSDDKRMGIKRGMSHNKPKAQKSNVDSRISKDLETNKTLILKKIEEDNVIVQEYLIALSSGIDSNIIPLPRYVSIRIYLNNGKKYKEVLDAVQKLTKSISITILKKYEPKLGSWFQKQIARTIDAITKDELVKRLEKAERALELTHINKVQSEIDSNLGAAAASVILSLKEEENAAIQIGSLLIVKITENGNSRITTRTLTQKELVQIESEPSLMNYPNNILEDLS